MALVTANPAITIAELAHQVGRTTRAVELQLEKLKSQKRLIRKGADHGGHWEILRPPSTSV